ncbi:hypothetical protein BASA81_004032 [Batrachochytrium salamandrivorans]|nr:hypothetical protein BASA81_004032 [Batrachochytrium salamandrivorans]
MEGDEYERQLDKVEQIRLTLLRRQERINNLEFKLEQCVAELNKQRSKCKLLTASSARLGEENLELKQQLVDFDSALQRAQGELHRLLELESNFRYQVDQVNAREDRANVRVRQLESHCAELAAKHSAVCDTNAKLCGELTSTQALLKIKQTELVEVQLDCNAKVDLLQLELREKHSTAVELANQVRGLEYKHQRELVKMERLHSNQVAQANDQVEQVHLVLQDRETKAGLAIELGQQWHAEQLHVAQTRTALINTREWAFAMLDVVAVNLLGKSNKRSRLRRVVLAILFALSLRTKVKRSKAIAWRPRDVLQSSIQSFTGKLVTLQNNVNTLSQLQVQVIEHGDLLRAHELQALQLDTVNAELIDTARAKLELQTQLARQVAGCESQSVSQLKQLEKFAVLLASLEQALVDKQSEVDKLLGQVKRQARQLRQHEATAQVNQQTKLDGENKLAELQLELETAREMLIRTKRYAEAEIASLSGILSRQ